MSLEKLYGDAAVATLADAECLPFSLYRDRAVYELEKQKIFYADWVFACAAKQVSERGDYFAFTLADEPIVIIRGQDDQLRVMSNVCRHRGALLNVEGFGKARKMICPYHAWTYNDDGQLLAAPLAADHEVDQSRHCLPQFAVEVWQGLVFVSLNDGAEPLADRYQGIERYLALYGSDQFDHFYEGKLEHWQCNWKLAMENAMESYHLFRVHRDTLETLTPTRQAFYLEGGADWSLTGGQYKHPPGKLTQWLMGGADVTQEHYVLMALPPGFVGILGRDSLAWINVLPTGPDSCTVRSGALSFSGKVDQAEEQFTDAFFAEDKAICERVQRGVNSQFGRGGSLLEVERIVVDFHHYLASRIAGEKGTGIYRAGDNIFFPA
ncbi:MAG: aromatic ring-hydroxylating dioxygenase subunit alpha [Candidatus Pelagadaptatus aseana]|uniref:aromatic ring-hydroxylating oxygenase subunit alpha n=1 Tax=Candidatus Pelagadaptatus aseana TaxID=3120508 RepID=UPI0039B2397C